MLGRVMNSRYITGHLLVFICQLILMQRWSSQPETHDSPTSPILSPASDQSSSDSLIPSLHTVLEHFGSDKELRHGYSRYYDPIFEPLRNQPIRLVEIGVEGGNSMRTWVKYFSNPGYIYGIGYKNGDWQGEGVTDCTGLQLPATLIGRCSLIKGDQSDPAFLESFRKKTGGNYTFVIDDGSHVPSHQLTSFESLWPSIVPGGYYFIEDIETNYWRKTFGIYGYMFTNEKSLIGHMKLVADVVNRKYTNGNSPLSNLYNDISSIQFGQNIIIIRKAGVEEREKYIEGKYWQAKRSGEGTKGLPFP